MREELALYGGERTAPDPFPPWPQFAERTFLDIQEPLRSGRVAAWSGERCKELEGRWAAWNGTRFAVSCSSGTAALHLALLGLGIGPGDEVILPSHTFFSTTLAVLHTGARAVFADVAEDQTLDPRGIPALMGPRTRAIVAVHLYGVVCAMDRIRQIAQAAGIKVLEDCAQCVGGEMDGRMAGSLGDAGCFSFSEGKHICAAGEGGMVVTDREDLALACRSLRDYGRDPLVTSSPPHVRVGYNYRMTEIQGIVARNELDRLDSWNLTRRRGFARTYDHAFSQLPGVKAVPLDSQHRRNAYWKYPLQLDLARLACPGDEVREALSAEGVPGRLDAVPESYPEPALASGDGAPEGRRCPTAEALRQGTVLLSLPPSWERSHIELCVAAVKKVLRAYRR